MSGFGSLRTLLVEPLGGEVGKAFNPEGLGRYEFPGFTRPWISYTSVQVPPRGVEPLFSD